MSENHDHLIGLHRANLVVNPVIRVESNKNWPDRANAMEVVCHGLQTSHDVPLAKCIRHLRGGNAIQLD
jgi:hypothetical protein